MSFSLPDQPASADGQFQPGLSLRKVWQAGSAGERWQLLFCWLVAIMASVGLGMASVIYAWSGLPLSFGGVQMYVSVYPPLLICTWLALTVGWGWGALPAYLSSLTLALYAGMPWYWAALFACGNPAGLWVMVCGYRAIALPKNLNSWRSLVFYLQMVFVGSMFSSLAAFIWCYTNRIDTVGVFAIWQGWWLGNFLQSTVLIAPLLALSWPAMNRWLAGREAWRADLVEDRRRLVLQMLGVLIAGVLIYALATVWLGARMVELQMSALGLPVVMQTVAKLVDMAWAFFWVISLVLVFLGSFGYQMFLHWHGTNQGLLDRLARANSELEQRARLDGLTGLLNRQSLTEELEAYYQQGRMQQASVMMIDIDHFKSINDTHGHATGDEAIRKVSALLRATVRASDLVGRYGGEEFVVVLPGCDTEAAATIAESVRAACEACEVYDGVHRIPLRLSIGVAQVEAWDATAEGWLRRADEALYEAKRGGRNRVCLA